MSKAIKSTDPIKAIIVKMLKQKSGGTRVTNVKETKDDEGNKVYCGDCMANAGGYWNGLGTFTVHQDSVMNATYKASKNK